MNNFNRFAIPTILAVLSINAVAAAVDNNDVVPPAQIQKNQLPVSSNHGDYLEPQPDDNGATDSTVGKNGNNKDTLNKHTKTLHKNKSTDTKATNIEKSKRLTETPENGGTEIN